MFLHPKFIEQLKESNYSYSGVIENKLEDRTVNWFSFYNDRYAITGRKDIFDIDNHKWNFSIADVATITSLDETGRYDYFIRITVDDEEIYSFINQLNIEPRKRIF